MRERRPRIKKWEPLKKKKTKAQLEKEIAAWNKLYRDVSTDELLTVNN